MRMNYEQLCELNYVLEIRSYRYYDDENVYIHSTDAEYAKERKEYKMYKQVEAKVDKYEAQARTASDNNGITVYFTPNELIYLCDLIEERNSCDSENDMSRELRLTLQSILNGEYNKRAERPMKEYKLKASDDRWYNVKARDKSEAIKTLNKYIRERR